LIAERYQIIRPASPACIDFATPGWRGPRPGGVISSWHA